MGHVVRQASLSLGALERMLTLLRPMLVPFTLGSTLGGLVMAGIAYVVVLAALRARRRGHIEACS